MPGEGIEEIPAHRSKLSLNVVTFIMTVARVAGKIPTASGDCGSVTGYCNVHVRVLKQIYEPVHEKTNNLGSDQVRHKPACTVAEDG